jgi:WD repeat-containing protein 68
MDASRNTHYSPYSYQQQQQQPQQQRSTQDTVQPLTKEIYQYDAPWSTYALDWCKTPIEQKSFRLAVGSFIEDSNNKVTCSVFFFCSSRHF